MFFTLLPLLFALVFLGLAFLFPPVKRNIIIALSLLVMLAWGFTFTQVTLSSYAYPTRTTLPLNSPLPTPAPTATPLHEDFEWPSNILDFPTPTRWIDLKGFTSIPNIVYEHMSMTTVHYFDFAIIILMMAVIGITVVVANTHFYLAQVQTQLNTQVMKSAAIEQLLTTAVQQLENKLETKLEVLSLNKKQIDANATQIDEVQKVVHDIIATLKFECNQAASQKAAIDTTTKAIDTLNNQMDLVVKTLTAFAKDSANKS